MPSAISTVPSVIGTTSSVVTQRCQAVRRRRRNAIGSANPTLIKVTGSARPKVVTMVRHARESAKKF